MHEPVSARPSRAARLVAVPAALRGLVVQAYVVASDDGHAAWTIADGTVDLVVSLGETPGAFVNGPALAAQRHTLAGCVRLAGLSLRPGAGALLGPDAAQLAATWLPLRDVAGGGARGLEARDAEGALERLFAFVAARAERLVVDGRAERALRAIDERGGRVKIDALARAAGASERTLLRLFERHVGLAPKELARVARFQRALAAIASGAPLAIAAHAAGFADQAHLTREFGALAGAPPSRWIAQGMLVSAAQQPSTQRASTCTGAQTPPLGGAQGTSR
jgi:AraC-like DNA-binding protein